MNRLVQDRFPFRYLAYFLLIAIVISVTGYLFYVERKNLIEDELSRHIVAIKEIKLQQIEGEQHQRKKIIESFLNIPSVNSEFIRLFTSKPNRSVLNKISNLTDDLLISIGFSSINVFSRNVDIIYTTDSLHNIKQNFMKHELLVMLGNDSSSITNMYIGDNKNLVQAVVVPIRSNNITRGYIWAEYSFFEYLHPIIDYTKGEPGNVEFILAKSDGNLAFLIKDISRDEIASIQTLPVSSRDRETLRTIPEEAELIKGIEFRGKRIYASAKNIAGTDWNLITKINEDQVIKSVQNDAIVIFLISILLITLSASITYAIWKRSRLYFLARTFNLKKEKDQLSERYTSLTRYANDIILTMNTDGRILEANKKAIDLYGYSEQEIVNKNFFDLSIYDYEDEKTIFDQIELDDGTMFESIHRRKDGSSFPVEISAKYVEQDSEKIILAIIRDYSVRKKLQFELIEAKERAEENDRLKTIILSNMSHELNTPMSGIIGFSEILQAELDDTNQREMALLINKSSRRLNETLTAILDLSKIESQQFKLNYDNIEVNSFIEEYTSSIKSDAVEKGLKFDIQRSEEKVYIKADSNILLKIIKYIVNNAVKYTKEGQVNITLYQNAKNVVIKIKDTGIGISKENLDLIFEPFRQVSEGSNRDYEGTGIGLTITKKLVELLDGTIEIESQLDRGTTVILRFPISAVKS